MTFFPNTLKYLQMAKVFTTVNQKLHIGLDVLHLAIALKWYGKMFLRKKQFHIISFNSIHSAI